MVLPGTPDDNSVLLDEFCLQFEFIDNSTYCLRRTIPKWLPLQKAKKIYVF